MAEKFEVPPEVKSFVDLLHLNVVEQPMKLLPPGFKTPVYLIPVKDEGTGETVGILNAYPPYERERYAIVTITNKLGNPVTVITFAEEAERLSVPKPRPEEVEKAVEEVEREVPEKVVSAPVDWRWIKGIVERASAWLSQMERQAGNRNALACYTYLKSVNEWIEDVRKKLVEASKLLSSYETRKPTPKVLKDEEYDRLWGKFSEALRAAGVKPEEYKDRFDELIAWDMPYEDNEYILLDEARKIIFQKRLERYVRKVPVDVKFSWKYIEWGLGSLRLSMGLLKDAADEENAVQAYSAAADVLNTAEKMKKLLETTHEVRDLLGGEG